MLQKSGRELVGCKNATVGRNVLGFDICISGKCCLRQLECLELRRAVYQQVRASLDAQMPLRGALFWEWTFPGEMRGDRGVESNDTTFG